MIKFGWDFMMWESNGLEVKPTPQRPDGDRYDIKTMWHRLAQGDDAAKLAEALVGVLNEIDCHEWEIPVNFPPDIVEWTFIAETVSHDIQEWDGKLIALDSGGGYWIWRYHPDKGALTMLSQP